MSHYNTVLNDLLDLFPRHQFDRVVEDLDGDRYVKKLSTWNQLTVLLYAQASGKTSLREIENGLLAQSARLYHLGLPDKVARSTLSDANNKRDWKIYEQLFYALLERCRDMSPTHKFRFKNPLYSFDSTVIALAVESFPWARYARRQGAIKLHYQFEHGGQIPVFMTMTNPRCNDLRIAKEVFSFIPDSIYCFDRGYFDFSWFRRIHDEKAFFVTRARNNTVLRHLGQQERPQGKGVLADFIVQTAGGFYAERGYPYPMRLIAFFDSETGRYLEFLTNNFTLSAATIAAIYKARWQIETFFRWIKQNLKIKTFLGTSKNAVLTQIWVAMCYYLLLTYVKYQSRYKSSLFYLHRAIKETLLERIKVIDLLRLSESRLKRLTSQDPQLCLRL